MVYSKGGAAVIKLPNGYYVRKDRISAVVRGWDGLNSVVAVIVGNLTIPLCEGITGDEQRVSAQIESFVKKHDL
jgi:phosphohistidine swiveling domain-containing protein